MWRERGLREPGGLLVTMAVCMAPLAVYGFERMTGLWLQGGPGEYRDFYYRVEGSWFPMEVSTVVAGLAALRFFRFTFLTAPIALFLSGLCLWTSRRLSTGRITDMEMDTSMSRSSSGSRS